MAFRDVRGSETREQQRSQHFCTPDAMATGMLTSQMAGRSASLRVLRPCASPSRVFCAAALPSRPAAIHRPAAQLQQSEASVSSSIQVRPRDASQGACPVFHVSSWWPNCRSMLCAWLQISRISWPLALPSRTLPLSLSRRKCMLDHDQGPLLSFMVVRG